MSDFVFGGRVRRPQVDLDPEWETTTRPSGVTPTDEPGYTSWEPLGVSPEPTVYRRASVVWKRRRLPCGPNHVDAGVTLVGVLAGMALGVWQAKKSGKKK